MLTILTINKDNADGLLATINSVISQTYFDHIQYIIVDGASTDASSTIISKYKSYINLAISEPDAGIYDAMNKGTKYATGDYILYLNSGDVLVNDTVIEQCFNYLNNEDIIYCRELSPGNRLHRNHPNHLNLAILLSSSLPHQSTFIKTELAKKFPYDTYYKVFAASDFFIARIVFENCSYKKLDIDCAIFDNTGISSQRGCFTRFLPERVHMLQKFLNNYQCTEEQTTIIHKYLNKWNKILN